MKTGLSTSEHSEHSRREFLRLMGASLALAGASGCIRMPEEKLVPYAHRPPSRTPGVPVSYATAMEIGGIAQGLLVTSCDGRPIKIEGNPNHPLNRGACDAIAQASILELYDPDRSRGVIRRNADGTREASSWEEFARWAKEVFKGDGEGICVLSEVSSSPSLADMRARLKKALPKAEWYEYEPSGDVGFSLGDAVLLHDVMFSDRMPSHGVLDLAQAKIIVAIDADLFGGGDPMAIKYARDFAAGRRLHGADGEMNRLYVIESAPTVTGACADHRRPLRPSAIPYFVRHLGQALGLAEDMPPIHSGIDSVYVEQIAADLKTNRGKSVIIPGRRLDLSTRILVDKLNDALGSIGPIIVPYKAPSRTFPGIHDLDKRLLNGTIATLLILDGNPTYNAPDDLCFANSLTRVKNTIHLGLHDDETSRLCSWHLSRAHCLESWGDAVTYDGTVSIVQPLIEPLFDGRSGIEVLAMILGDKDGVDGSGYGIVRRTFHSLTSKSSSEWKWKKALADGVVEGTAWKPALKPDEDRRKPLYLESPIVEQAGDAPPLKTGKYELVFLLDAKVYDGRFANNGWLQEMPDPMTRLTWENAALMNENTAKKIGLKRDELVALEGEETQEVEFPVLFQPGMPEGVIAVALGYGRTAAGNIGNGVGSNAYLLRDSKSIERSWTVVTARPTGKTHALATVQDHHIIDRVGKEAVQERIPDLIHEGTLAEYRKDPSLGHTNVFGTRRVPAPSAPHTACAEYSEGTPSIFDEHRLDGRPSGATAGLSSSAANTAGQASSGTPAANVPAHDFHRWGMAVDLTACTGCGACVVACQAENNIPIVGRDQVLLGREMHWIRVDQYFEDRSRVGQAGRRSHQWLGTGWWDCASLVPPYVSDRQECLSSGAVGASAGAVHAVRECAVRGGLPVRRHHAQPRRSQHDDLQPLRRHALLLEQLPI